MDTNGETEDKTKTKLETVESTNTEIVNLFNKFSWDWKTGR